MNLQQELKTSKTLFGFKPNKIPHDVHTTFSGAPLGCSL